MENREFYEEALVHPEEGYDKDEVFWAYVEDTRQELEELRQENEALKKMSEELGLYAFRNDEYWTRKKKLEARIGQLLLQKYCDNDDALDYLEKNIF